NFLTSEEAINLVSRGKIELAMVTLPNKPIANLEFIPVWRDELYVAIPNTAEYRNASLEELAKKPVILPHEVSTTRQNLDKIFNQHNLTFSHITETSNFEVIAKMIETGLGWSVLPSHMINDSIVSAFTDTFVAVRTQGVVRHAQRQLSLASQALLNLMIDQLGDRKMPSNSALSSE
ncbi:LysR family transcriptional regulator substrate-binding protein, partial [Arenicella sp.]|nr:LysR family transcriptional regulator substrate-binding protein [Arenicella sp.]